MRALVTGGAGFIGSYVVDALVARGDDVVAFDDLSSGHRDNLAGSIAAGARLVVGSITDEGALDAVFAEHGPDAIFHFAAQIDVRRSIRDPNHDLSLNVGGTINLLERARRTPNSRFLFASTGGAIYGEGAGRELPLDEAAACRPDAQYGQSKLAAEGYVSLYSRLYGVGATCLRLGNVYGPRQDPHGEAGVVAIYCGAMLRGEVPIVFGDGQQTRDYVFVGDVAAAFLAAATSDRGGTYNIGTGVETSVVDLGAVLGEALGTPFEPQAKPARPGEVQRIAIDPARALEDLGWRAEHELGRGLEITAESFRTMVDSGPSSAG